MTHLTTTAQSPRTFADAALIRPADGRTLQALRQLARNGGARVERGAICLAGAPHAALLAIGDDGRLLAAVLLGENGADGAASLASSTTTSSTTERASSCAQNSQEV